VHNLIIIVTRYHGVIGLKGEEAGVHCINETVAVSGSSRLSGFVTFGQYESAAGCLHSVECYLS
jgi:hypothetical protein